MASSSKKKQEKSSSASKKLCKCMLISGIAYISLPILMFIFPSIIEQVIFLNLLCLPKNFERLHEPQASYNLSNCGHFTLETNGMNYGMWHIAPYNVKDVYKDGDFITDKQAIENLKNVNNVILYLHGNGRHRGIQHRLTMYKLLQEELPSHHLVTFDYRGFGDSPGWPSREGLIQDTISVLTWLRMNTKKDAKITIWGHSLGSSIGTLATSKLTKSCKEKSQNTCVKPDYLLLEGAFRDLRLGAEESPLAQIVPQFVFDILIDNALDKFDLHLKTEVHITDVDVPILILHAEDDGIIHVHHGDDLFDLCEKYDHKNTYTYIRLTDEYSCGHNDIANNPMIVGMIKKFYNGEIRKKLCTKIEV